jgi:nucleoside-diphosphate-sugar epimerase
MAILVTGGAGYVGMNVVEALLERGDDVVVFDAGAQPPAIARRLRPYRSRVRIVKASVCNAAALERAFARRAIDGVVHCAAVTAGPAREASDPAISIDVNVRGTLNVLDAARRHKTRRIVCASSAAVYGESLYRLARIYEDTSPVAPVTLYGVTKLAAEGVCVRLRTLWEIDVVCARLGTLIGPWERDTGVRDNFGTHSQLARCALAGMPAVLPVHTVRRDWVYSRDVARGLLALLDVKSTRHAIYNLSAGIDWGVLDWCAALAAEYPRFSYRIAAAGETATIGYTDRDRCLMDIGRIAHDVGFHPQYEPATAYADFLAWLKRTPDFWNAQQ